MPRSNRQSLLSTLNPPAKCAESESLPAAQATEQPPSNGLELAGSTIVKPQAHSAAIPLACVVECAVDGDKFRANAVSLSETCVRVHRHPRLSLGTTARISFRVPCGRCADGIGTVVTHDGENTVLHLDLGNADRSRLLECFRGSSPISKGEKR